MALLRFFIHTKQKHTHLSQVLDSLRGKNTPPWHFPFKQHLQQKTVFHDYSQTHIESHLHAKLFKEIKCLICHLDLLNMSRCFYICFWGTFLIGLQYRFAIALSLSMYLQYAKLQIGHTTWDIILQFNRKWKKPNLEQTIQTLNPFPINKWINTISTFIKHFSLFLNIDSYPLYITCTVTYACAQLSLPYTS